MPGKRAARPPRNNRVLRSGIAVAVALLLLLVGWGASALIGGDGDPTASTAPSSTPTGAGPTATDSPSSEASEAEAGAAEAASPDASPSRSAAAVPAALRACASEVDAAEKVVTAAREGVDNWRMHVQARTDMLDGRMSVAEMDDMWAMTRRAGPADQRRFRKAMDSYDEQAACKDLRDLPKPQRKAAADCAARFESAMKAVDAAEAAMADWRSHLDNMATYAAGGMSRDEAQTRWVQAWKSAPANIEAYDQDREALTEAPACSTSAG